MSILNTTYAQVESIRNIRDDVGYRPAIHDYVVNDKGHIYMTGYYYNSSGNAVPIIDRSTNEGLSWQRLKEFDYDNYGTIASVRLTIDYENNIYVMISEATFNYETWIYRSEDEGKSWQDVYYGKNSLGGQLGTVIASSGTAVACAGLGSAGFATLLYSTTGVSGTFGSADSFQINNQNTFITHLAFRRYDGQLYYGGYCYQGSYAKSSAFLRMYNGGSPATAAYISGSDLSASVGPYARLNSLCVDQEMSSSYVLLSVRNTSAYTSLSGTTQNNYFFTSSTGNSGSFSSVFYGRTNDSAFPNRIRNLDTNIDFINNKIYNLVQLDDSGTSYFGYLEYSPLSGVNLNFGRGNRGGFKSVRLLNNRNFPYDTKYFLDYTSGRVNPKFSYIKNSNYYYNVYNSDHYLVASLGQPYEFEKINKLRFKENKENFSKNNLATSLNYIAPFSSNQFYTLNNGSIVDGFDMTDGPVNANLIVAYNLPSGYGLNKNNYILNNVSEYPFNSPYSQMKNIRLGTAESGKVGSDENSIIKINRIGSYVQIMWPAQDVNISLKGYSEDSKTVKVGSLESTFSSGDYVDVGEYDKMTLFCYLKKYSSGTLDDVVIQVERKPLKDINYTIEQGVEIATSGSYTEARHRDLYNVKEIDYGDLAITEIGWPIDIDLVNTKRLRISAKHKSGQASDDNKNLIIYGRFIKSSKDHNET